MVMGLEDNKQGLFGGCCKSDPSKRFKRNPKLAYLLGSFLVIQTLVNYLYVYPNLSDIDDKVEA